MQLQQSQSQYKQGQMALRDQLQAQRAEAQQARSQLSEQAYMANRNINQGAQSRGLGNSGIKDLATIQSQMAQGQNLNQLEQTNIANQRQSLGTKLALSQQYTAGQSDAQNNYLKNTIEADYAVSAADDKRKENLLQLFELAKAGASTAEIQSVSKILGVNAEDLVGTELEAQIKGYTPVGKKNFNTITESILSGGGVKIYNDTNGNRVYLFNGKTFTTEQDALKELTSVRRDINITPDDVTEFTDEGGNSAYIYKGRPYTSLEDIKYK